MTNPRRIIACLVCVAAAGCLPEKRVVWSPDGQRAAVIGSDGLYLCDAQGTLSGRMIAGAKRAAWLPDSRRLVVARTQDAAHWEDVGEATKAYPEKLIVQLAQKVRDELDAHQGDLDKFEPKALDGVSGGASVAVFVYVRDHLNKGLAEKLGSAKWEEFQSVKIPVQVVQTYEVKGDRVEGKAIVYQSLDETPSLSVSPSGEHVAFIQPLLGAKNVPTLMVASTGGGARARPVATLVSPAPDWSEDGRYLVFARTTSAAPRLDDDSEQPLRLGTLSRRQVCDEKGHLLKVEPQNNHKPVVMGTPVDIQFPNIEDLAGLVFQEFHGIKCLRDGRILFSAAEVHLPTTAKDMPGRLSVFSVDPARQAVVTRILTREAENSLPNALSFFEVSPDERQIAIPGAKGQIAVFTIASGDIEQVQDQSSDQLATLPTWRTSGELCFAVPKEHPCGSAGRSEVVLWTSKTCRAISRDWPEMAIRGFLIPEKEAAKSKGAADGK